MSAPPSAMKKAGGARRPVRRRAVFIEEENRPSEWRHVWLAIFGFYILLTETGVRQVMNGFVLPVMESYNCTKKQADTAVLMIPMSSSLIAGPPCSMFYQYAGARISIVLGASLCFGGFVAGAFSPSIELLMVCSLAIGVGCGLMRNSIISIQCEYFKKQRNTVMTFISIGPGIGVFILPRILKKIMVEYNDWGPAWLFLASLYVVSGVMGLFIGRKPSQLAGQRTFLHFTGIQVFKKWEFVLHLFASFCASTVVIIYVSNILVLMNNENITDPATVYSYQGIASIIGKTLLTGVMSLNRVHIAVIMIFNYIVAQTALFSGAFCYSLWHFRLQNFFAGFGIGLFQACLAPFLVAIAGPSQLPGALGYTNLVNGFAIFTGIYISALTGGDDMDVRRTFFVAMWLGLAAIIMSVINSILLMAREKHKRKPSMKQMRHSSELNALTNITSVENS